MSLLQLGLILDSADTHQDKYPANLASLAAYANHRNSRTNKWRSWMLQHRTCLIPFLLTSLWEAWTYWWEYTQKPVSSTGGIRPIKRLAESGLVNHKGMGPPHCQKKNTFFSSSALPKGPGKRRHWPDSELSTPLINHPYLPLPGISTFSTLETPPELLQEHKYAE